ncbi:uncharacterized protein [Euphorbia lathyris]|uniref:uncharacterized protein isoform X1 n=1 Tax=Euphorbia lathyris TaxID=212925 RepID=UPI00331380DF
MLLLKHEIIVPKARHLNLVQSALQPETTNTTFPWQDCLLDRRSCVNKLGIVLQFRQNYLVVYRLHMNYLHSLTRSAMTVLLGLILMLKLSGKNMSVQWLSVLRVKETEQ